jgi:precorrin-6A synthase
MSRSSPASPARRQILISGTVGEVGRQIAETRAEAREQNGWIMDVYLLRR